MKTRDLCLCGVFAALTAVGALIKIPVPVCPVTLQLFFTTMGGILLGKRLGALSVTIYVIIGLLGIPVFTGGGGLGYVLQPTFGYLLGFMIGAYVTGLIAGRDNRPSLRRLLCAGLAGLVIVYGIGMAYLYFIYNCVLGTEYGLRTILLYCFALIAPGDIALCAVAAVLGKRMVPILKQNRGYEDE